MIIIHNEDAVRSAAAAANSIATSAHAALVEQERNWASRVDSHDDVGAWQHWIYESEVDSLFDKRDIAAHRVWQMEHPHAAWREEKVVVINLPLIRRKLARMFLH